MGDWGGPPIDEEGAGLVRPIPEDALHHRRQKPLCGRRRRRRRATGWRGHQNFSNKYTQAWFETLRTWSAMREGGGDIKTVIILNSNCRAACVDEPYILWVIIFEIIPERTRARTSLPLTSWPRMPRPGHSRLKAQGSLGGPSGTGRGPVRRRKTAGGEGYGDLGRIRTVTTARAP